MKRSRRLQSAEQEKLRLLDLWQFQRKEIESAGLRAGEDAELEAERQIQRNAGRLLETAAAAFETLYESPVSALSGVRIVAKKLDELARIDDRMETVRQAMEPAVIALEEAAWSLRDYLARVEANPARLDQIETRLAAIDKLKRKYGGSAEEILAFLDQVTRQIGEVENAGERLEALQRARAVLAAEYETAAAELSAKRKDAAAELAKRVERELKSLAMERTVFRIGVVPAGMVRGRKRCRAVSGLAKHGRRAKTDGADRFGRRTVPHCAGAEDLPDRFSGAGGSFPVRSSRRRARWSSTKSTPGLAGARRKG